jgi:hypothetical protein
MYFIIILTIEINNDNNKNDIVWQILSLFFFSQSRRFADRLHFVTYTPEKQKYQKSRKEEQ